MPPIVPEPVDCENLEIDHPACPDRKLNGSVLATSDDPPDEDNYLEPVTMDDPNDIPPEEEDLAMVEETSDSWPDPSTEDTPEDTFEESTTVATDGLRHPTSPVPHDKGELTMFSTTIWTKSLDEKLYSNVNILDLAGDNLDTETDTDWGVVASIVCLVLVLAILTGE